VSKAQGDQSGGLLLNASSPDRAHRKLTLASVVSSTGRILSGGLGLGQMRERLRAEAEARFNRGVGLCRQGKLGEAISDLREAIMLEPDFADAFLNLGMALCRQGKFEEAIAELREAIRLHPDLAAAHYNLGFALYREERLEEAIAELREAIRLHPDLAAAHYNLGFALYRQRVLGAAITESQEAIRLNPKGADVHYNLGVVHNDHGRLEEAIPEFREAIRIQPDFAEAQINLGNALDRRGMDPDIARIVEKVHRARALGIEDEWHDHLLNPRLSEEARRAFEAAHDVLLPDGYRRFLTQAGNGGTGPFGGLLPLEDSEDLPQSGRPSYFVPELGTDLAPLAASLADDDDLLRGTLLLATEGCGWTSLLIVAGPARGRVVSVGEYELHFNDAEGFLDWYEKWIDRELPRPTPAWWTPTK
jgi:tetratricopeptide (TPR) repeat protein